MTTIAYDGKTLASDTQGSCSFIEQHKFLKIHETPEYWIAGSGSYCHTLEWIDWFKGGFEGKFTPSGEENNLGGLFLVEKQTGLLAVYCPTSPHPIVPSSHCINAMGSGEQFAMGAMLGGCSAEQAVIIASQLDANTGEVGQVIPLSSGKGPITHGFMPRILPETPKSCEK